MACARINQLAWRPSTIDLRAAAMPIIIKTAGFDVSPSDRWQILTLLRAVTCANLDAAMFIFEASLFCLSL